MLYINFAYTRIVRDSVVTYWMYFLTLCMLQHSPATALDRLAHMISGRAVEEAVTTNLFAWVRWIVTKEVDFSEDCCVDWKIDCPLVYYNVFGLLLLRKAQLPWTATSRLSRKSVSKELSHTACQIKPQRSSLRACESLNDQ